MKKRRLTPSFWIAHHRRVVFVAAVALLGAGLLLAIRAAVPVSQFEPERAPRSATTTVASDPAASGGAYLQFGGPAGTPATRPAQLSGNWRTVFQDEFLSASAFANTWEQHAPFSALHPGSVAVANGLLTMKVGEITNYDWAIVSTAGPRSAGEPSYPKMKAWREGYFEARLRYTDSEWSWPAFWLFSAAKSEAWPGEHCPSKGGYFNAEWDMMENGVQNGWQHRPAGDWYARVIHKNTTDNTPDGYCAAKDEDRQFAKDYTGKADLSAWHTWGGRWIGNELCTYLDNQLIDCTTAFDTMAQPMELHLDINYLGTCPSWCGTKPKQLEMQVDWVRVWQRY